MKIFNYKTILIFSFLLISFILIYFWRQDVEYKRCWDFAMKLESSSSVDDFAKSKCGQIIKKQYK
jgi:uncharacterized membrane protein